MKWTEDWSQAAEQLVTTGSGSIVADQLTSMDRSTVPAKHLAGFARLCRRVGMPLLGIQALYTTVKAETADPSVEELAEYANCLARIGRNKEAISIFDSIPEAKRLPYSLKYVDSLFNSWEYQKGKSVLEGALAGEGDSYRRKILSVNFLAALVALEQWGEAEDYGNQLREELSSSGANKLLGNTLELLGQVSIGNGDWQTARCRLESSLNLLEEAKSLSSLLPKKWLALGELKLGKSSRETALQGIEEVKNQARKFRHWESLRHMDYFVARELNDSDAFSRLYYSCSHDSFRKLYLDPIKSEFELSHHIRWSTGKAPQVLHLDQDLTDKNKKSIQTHQVLFKTLKALFSDYWTPLDVFKIHGLVFPEEYFNPNSSIDKVHKSMERLRAFLKDVPGLSLSIESNRDFGYRLRCESGLVVIYPEDTGGFQNSLVDQFVVDLRSHFGDQPFTRKDVDERLGLSVRKSNRRLAEARDSGQILSFGQGRGKHYKLAS